MLAKPYRLRKFRDFSQVYRQGFRCRSRCFSLCVYARLADIQEKPVRIGVTVGQKVSKKAVVRNQVKRRIRAVCRHLLSSFKPGYDVVIIARSAATRCEYSEFLQQLTQLFTNAELLHGHSGNHILRRTSPLG